MSDIDDPENDPYAKFRTGKKLTPSQMKEYNTLVEKDNQKWIKENASEYLENIFKIVHMKREGFDPIAQEPIPIGSKALRIETCKGVQTQVTFYAMKTAKKIFAQMKKVIEE